MALAGSRNANRGDALMRPAAIVLAAVLVTGSATCSATVDICFLAPNSDFNRALKVALGRLRKSAAMRTSGSTSLAAFAGRPSFRASIESRALFSCSIFFCSALFLPPFPGFRERLGIGTLHARPQTRECAKLQLLHRTLSLANLPRHFLDAFFFHKPQHHHPPLFHRQ